MTALEFRLYPAPHIYGGRLLWAAEMARPVLRAFRDLTRTAPDELTLWARLLRFPVLAEVPEKLRGGAFVSVDMAFLGSAPDAEELLAPLREIPATWLDTLGPMSPTQLSGITTELIGPEQPVPSSEFSALLRDLHDPAIDALLTVAGSGSGSPLVEVQLRHLGGALSKAAAADGPWGPITEPYQLFCRGVPTSPDSAADIHIAFVEVVMALQRHLTWPTVFEFLIAEDGPARAFSADALARLQAITNMPDPAASS